MILDKIFAHKRKELESRKAVTPLREVEVSLAKASEPRDFRGALRRPGEVRLIGELKKASPSAGVIRKSFNPTEIAGAYQRAGAAALSVLTDEEFFQGSLDHLRAARKATGLPVLRKDFLFDVYQIREARAAGADAVLLIVAMLPRPELEALLAETSRLGMAALVEVHTSAELETALAVGAEIIGINNRDLRTFHVNLETTLLLRPLIPPGRLVVSESGIKCAGDVARLKACGVDAILVGEAFMRNANIEAAVRQLMGRP